MDGYRSPRPHKERKERASVFGRIIIADRKVGGDDRDETTVPPLLTPLSLFGSASRLCCSSCWPCSRWRAVEVRRLEGNVRGRTSLCV